MKQITLAEAYQQREALEKTSKAIYCKQRNTGVLYKVRFPPPQEVQQGPRLPLLIERSDGQLLRMYLLHSEKVFID